MNAEETLQAIRTDVAYALQQLKRWQDVGRATDALERVESCLREYYESYPDGESK